MTTMPLTDRLAAALDGQVRLERVDVGVPEHRGEQLDALGVGVPEVLGRVAQQRAAVRREVQPRLRLAGPAPAWWASAISSLIAACVVEARVVVVTRA